MAFCKKLKYLNKIGGSKTLPNPAIETKFKLINTEQSGEGMVNLTYRKA